MSSNSSSIASEIYSGTAEFGKIWALISAVIATIISIIMIIIGIYILTLKSKDTKVSATIIKINNSTTNVCDEKDFNCTITISYIYNNRQQTRNINKPKQNQVYKVGDSIDVYIDDKSSVATQKDVPPKMMGFVLLITSVIILVSSWFWYWASKKYKPVAAAEGIGGILNIATGGRL